MARRTNLKKLPRKRYVRDRSLHPVPPNVTLVSVTVNSPNTHVTLAFGGGTLNIRNSPPLSLLVNGLTPSSVLAVTPTTLTLLMPGAITAGDDFSIGDNDAAIRTPAGGYVTATSGEVS